MGDEPDIAAWLRGYAEYVSGENPRSGAGKRLAAAAEEIERLRGVLRDMQAAERQAVRVWLQAEILKAEAGAERASGDESRGHWNIRGVLLHLFERL